jgi:hypothetical protein
MSSLDDRVDALFADLPTDPQQRLDAVARLYAAIRERAAKHLEPAVQRLLAKSYALGHEHKREVCQHINRVLDEAKLAILDPTTDVTAGLVVNRPSPDSHVSRFCLQDHGGGKRHVTLLRGLEASMLHLVSTRRPDSGGPER